MATEPRAGEGKFCHDCWNLHQCCVCGGVERTPEPDPRHPSFDGLAGLNVIESPLIPPGKMFMFNPDWVQQRIMRDFGWFSALPEPQDTYDPIIEAEKLLYELGESDG